MGNLLFWCSSSPSGVPKLDRTTVGEAHSPFLDIGKTHQDCRMQTLFSQECKVQWPGCETSLCGSDKWLEGFREAVSWPGKSPDLGVTYTWRVGQLSLINQQYYTCQNPKTLVCDSSFHSRIQRSLVGSWCELATSWSHFSILWPIRRTRLKRLLKLMIQFLYMGLSFNFSSRTQNITVLVILAP